MNAYAVLAPQGLVPEGMDVAVVQAKIFGDAWGPVGYDLFLVMAFLMLFSVMWTVIDALTRIVTDIIHTNARAGHSRGAFRVFERFSIGHLYYGIITLVVIVSALLIPLRQPLTLLVISGVLSGLTMAIYTPFLIYLNNTRLAKPLRSSWLTNVAMACISVFFIYFSYRVISEAVRKLFG